MSNRTAISIIIGSVIILTPIIYFSEISLPISKNTEEIFWDDAILREYVQTYGVEQSLTRLDEIQLINGDQGTCHVRAHTVGETAYKLFGSEAFGMCGIMQCGGGCFHGAIGSFAQKNGTKNFTRDLADLCLDSKFKDQCMHGFGHGIMGWTNYDLPKALDTCDKITQDKFLQNECWRGVFMENVVASFDPIFGHVSEYLSDDSEYPCSVVDEKYKAACEQFRIFRMGQLYPEDYEKHATECTRIPNPYHRACFSSIGTNIVNKKGETLQTASSFCTKFISDPESADICLHGALTEALFSKTELQKLSICEYFKNNTPITPLLFNTACKK
jgi:hypothetical protein